jgi:hypothetical protein
VFLDFRDFQDSERIEGKLMNCFKMYGLREEYRKENWIAIATDVATVVFGKQPGVVSRLNQNYPNLFYLELPQPQNGIVGL